MEKKDLIAAKLTEWGLRLTDGELAQLVPAYDNLLRWQEVVTDMLRSRKIAAGMMFPESEPLLIHAIEKGGPQR
jgi:hypothetical protein